MRRTPPLPLRSCRIRNFKAVRDSGPLTFTPLTVFIGNNGCGKSSAIEALETLKTMVLEGVDAAMAPWHGFEHAWNKATYHRVSKANPFPGACAYPMGFYVSGRLGAGGFRAKLEVTARDENCDRLDARYVSAIAPAKFVSHPDHLTADFRVREQHMVEMVSGWQFLSMAPQEMTEPRLKRRAGDRPVLSRDGANVADYLQNIYESEPGAFEGILDAMRSVLPYAEDIRPRVTSGIEKRVYLELTEHGFRAKLPSWLLSTGTVRILALLAVLRNPQPPSVLFVEEIENGLDPRTIHLLVREIASFIETGGQVVITTHSPYLLDLLDLSQIIAVERSDSGAPTFVRPSVEALKQWSGSFAPGALYTMGAITKD
jgi:predicted ATPase